MTACMESVGRSVPDSVAESIAESVSGIADVRTYGRTNEVLTLRDHIAVRNAREEKA